MKTLSLFICVLVLLSCNKEKTGVELQEEDFKFKAENIAFSLAFPTDNWKITNLRGTDSYVGCYDNGVDSMFFDYGMYNGRIDKSRYTNPLYIEETTIDNCKALIVKEKNGNQTILSALIYKKNNIQSTALFVRNPKDDQKYIKIFKTHQFKTE